MHIDIIDMNGRKVATQTCEAERGAMRVRLDLSRLTNGAYFVRIYGDNLNIVKKLVVR